MLKQLHKNLCNFIIKVFGLQTKNLICSNTLNIGVNNLRI